MSDLEYLRDANFLYLNITLHSEVPLGFCDSCECNSLFTMTLKIVPKISISKLNFKIQLWKLISIYYLKTSLDHGFSLFYKHAFLDRLSNQIHKNIIISFATVFGSFPFDRLFLFL